MPMLQHYKIDCIAAYNPRVSRLCRRALESPEPGPSPSARLSDAPKSSAGRAGDRVLLSDAPRSSGGCSVCCFVPQEICVTT